MDTTLSQARRMNTPRAIAFCQCFNGALEFQAGNWDDAETALRESIRLNAEIGAASGEAFARQRLGVVLTTRGQLEEGKAVLEEGAAVAERAIMRAHCLTRIYATLARNRLAAGDVQAADSALALGLTMSERHGHCSTCNALLLPAAVSVRLAQNDIEGAAAFSSQLDAAAEEYASHMWRGMARQSRGELFAANGKFQKAEAFYREAHQDFLEAGNQYEAARCLEAISELERDGSW
ncbi:MAG: hypothetical protein Fur0022_22590 [Anaerolineales bacterium]